MWIDLGPGGVLVGRGEEAPWDAGGLPELQGAGVGALDVPVAGLVALPAHVPVRGRLVGARVVVGVGVVHPPVAAPPPPPVVHPVAVVVVVAGGRALDGRQLVLLRLVVVRGEGTAGNDGSVTARSGSGRRRRARQLLLPPNLLLTFISHQRVVFLNLCTFLSN